MNAKNIINAFNNEVKSFNTAIRFVFETAALKAEKIPAAPAKDDKTDEAKTLRAEIKKIENANNVIKDCIAIVERFNITVNDLKSKSIKALRDKILSNVPMLDVNGCAVKLAKLPAYLKDDVTDYKEIFTVVPASWIETIIAACEDIGNNQITGYNVTVNPIVENGEIIEGASGDIVDAKGNKVDSAKIFKVWDKIACYKNIANAAGRETANNTLADLKKA